MGKAFLFLACLVLATQAVDNDPEIEMNAPEIIQRWGYPVEIHTVETTDGYLIDIHRIPAGKNQVQTPNKPVVFMQHGFMCDSSNWIVNLPDQSAGFIFADAGYDVWLGNVRGNTYGKKHKTLNPKSEKFWEFSFDEHAAIDLPNEIDYVLQKTGQKSLNYIGHSQGTLTMFAHLSEDQTFVSKIQNFFALAPIGTMTHVEGLFGFLARNFDLELDALYMLFGSGEFLPSNNFMKVISKDFCGTNPTNDYCDNILFLISGPESTQFNDTRVAVYTSQTPAGVSTQNTIHFMQAINGAPGVVKKFDYQDPKKNQKKYGQDTPPAYDYSKVNAPTHLFWGDQDYLGDPMDIKNFLIPTLKPEFVKTNVELKNYNHMDFIWGLSTPTDVYAPILKTIQASNQGRFQRH